jgi:thiol-disulfide isomerase/thioredoxin
MSPIFLKAHHFMKQGNNVYIDTRVVGKNPGILLIWADWCPHCHNFLPIYNDLYSTLKNSNFTVSQIEHKELVENPRLSTALDFQYFPTIKFFDQTGKITETYQNERTKEKILDKICNVFHKCMK